MIPMPEIFTEEEADKTMVTAAQFAQSSGFDRFDVDRLFHGWAEARTYGGEPLMNVGELRATFAASTITDAASLHDTVVRWDGDAIELRSLPVIFNEAGERLAEVADTESDTYAERRAKFNQEAGSVRRAMSEVEFALLAMEIDALGTVEGVPLAEMKDD